MKLMMTRDKIYKLLTITVLLLLALGVLPGLASVWTASNVSAAIGRFQTNADSITVQSIEIQNVPVASFIQASDTLPGTDDANNWFFDFDGGFLRSDSATAQVCLVAPAYLQPNTTIDSFTAHVTDNSGSDNLSIFLDRTSLLGDWLQLAKITTTGQVGGIQTLTDANITTTDNANIVSADYNYHVSFCFPANSAGNMRFYGAQLSYQNSISLTEIYLPMVIKSVKGPDTNLLITNKTGGSLTYTVFNTPEGDITCDIPDNSTNSLCGTFTPGTYSYKAVANCGQKVGQRAYNSGDDSLSPFRCQ